ncbi:ABC transporter substrate-binding protein [Tepidiphilus thermophilus]|jgi:branched-chain amino acid transport system substrate-binding protein|uniref:ABC-type branched-chain amino acid transport system, periplasmic component n=1 Tax=Tepidiphilus thermophilus TaxID=876478 RepID=A0A0K6IV55_9PROT|nr:ABC transporter substrate-binding protein [Tepidiphilus thermophilus]MDK2796868.1 branched-chain amino acid transport system substrate-binding protein [Tepidiphilus sp.]CUB06954.1 ABC-type branched-chain amino acid transport system, periplasmic component [Tepidiphilus thermophilus]
MKTMFKKGMLGALFATAAFAAAPALQAQETVKFGLFHDFTKVYTFVADEFSQGQRDYLTLINEEGGIKGQKFEAIVRDHGNEPQRGLELYNRAREEGAIYFMFLSTPVANAVVPRALQDKVVLGTPLHGRGDAMVGETFPYVFPMMASYWSQAARLLKYVEDTQGGLKGKKIAHVHIDTPFGREPLPILEKLAQQKSFELRSFAYPSPGNEQSAVWSDVRRYRPDFVLIWGAGNSQMVSVREAVRNGIDPAKILSVVWLTETDMKNIGESTAIGAKRVEVVQPGRDHPIIQRILDKVYKAGKGAGPEARVGNTYYNYGVADMVIATEGAKLALEKLGPPLTGEKLKAGMEMIRNLDTKGFMPPVTITPQDHQGGGQARVSQWDGKAWVPVSDWAAAYQDVVWEEARASAAKFSQGK